MRHVGGKEVIKYWRHNRTLWNATRLYYKWLKINYWFVLGRIFFGENWSAWWSSYTNAVLFVMFTDKPFVTNFIEDYKDPNKGWNRCLVGEKFCKWLSRDLNLTAWWRVEASLWQPNCSSEKIFSCSISSLALLRNRLSCTSSICGMPFIFWNYITIFAKFGNHDDVCEGFTSCFWKAANEFRNLEAWLLFF